MARKAARLERAGALTYRDQIWALVRGLKRFTPAEIVALTKLRLDTVASYLVALGKAEPPYLLLVDADRPAGRPRRECWLYELVRDTGVDAPNLTADGKPSRQALGNVRMWKAMRALHEFNCAELALASSAPGHSVTRDAAQNYIRDIAQAGYVVAMGKLKSGVRWRFNRAMNTGPRPPIVERNRSIVDANTGQLAYDAAAARSLT